MEERIWVPTLEGAVPNIVRHGVKAAPADVGIGDLVVELGEESALADFEGFAFLAQPHGQAQGQCPPKYGKGTPQGTALQREPPLPGF